MGFINYSIIKDKYKNNNMMTNTIELLEMYDAFHLLRDSNSVDAVSIMKKVPGISQDYIGFLGVCGGGYLFDTTLLSIRSYDPDLDLDFDAFDEYNTGENREDFNVPDGYYIIAIRSYGDPICMRPKDKKVYLWDSEEGEFTVIWDSFFDFICDETQVAVDMIKGGELDPVPLKIPDDEE